MTSHHSIFIHPGHPVEALVADVALACGGRLRRAVNGPADYVVSLGDTTLELEMEHEYEEDKGIPFERYQVVLAVRESNSSTEREDLGNGSGQRPTRSPENGRGLQVPLGLFWDFRQHQRARASTSAGHRSQLGNERPGGRAVE